MGNRAVVCFANRDDIKKWIDPNDGESLHGFCEDNGGELVGVYLHWNGGRASIEGFCEACRRLKFRGPASDSYGVARFVQAVCNYFGGGLSCGVDTLAKSDMRNYDNGVYVVDDEWNIVGREFRHGAEQNDYDRDEFAKDVIAHMPNGEEYGKDEK